MTVGVEPCQADLFKGSAFVRERLGAESVFAVLEREGCRLFPEAMFDDLFSSRGRRSVPPRVVACVMVLQRWFGLSDREAVAAFEFDLRWRFACGGLDVDGGGFCHTVLVGMRARLAASGQPRRIFDAVLAAARQAGALSQRRVLDSVPIYDAVATQDTATMLHRAIRAVLAAASDAALGVDAALRGDYASSARAHCDWDDPRARQELVDRLGADAAAVLAALEGRELRGALSEAAELLAAVAGQDLCQDRGGRFMIARRVAKDRVLSTVDPDARHGHKSTARRFDGYKGHTAVDPDSELITATAVTPANTADAQPAPELINDLLNTADTAEDADTADTAEDADTADTAEDADTADTAEDADTADTAEDADTADTADAQPAPELINDLLNTADTAEDADTADTAEDADTADTAEDADTADTAEDAEDADTAEGGGVVEEFAGRPTVYGDSAYGSGEFQGLLQQSRINSRCRTQPAAAPGGRFTKDRFDVDLLSGTVTCPAGTTVAIRARGDGSGTAAFGAACHGCALRGDCTDAAGGRTVRISANEAVLAASRARQRDPAWRNDYRAVRPKVERKLAHLVRRKHGGRHARVRGRAKVDADFNLLAAAANIARLGVLGLRSTPQRWALG